MTLTNPPYWETINTCSHQSVFFLAGLTKKVSLFDEILLTINKTYLSSLLVALDSVTSHTKRNRKLATDLVHTCKVADIFTK